MLMVVMIISIILSTGAYSYRNQRRQVEFNDAVLKVSTLIKTARNYAVTSRSVYDTCQLPGEETYVPAEGYGVYIARSNDPGQARFVLFANTKADSAVNRNQYDELADDPCNSDLIEEEFQLNGKAILTDLLTSLSPTQVPLSSITHIDENEAVIIFKTALADTTLAANDHPVTPLNLTLPVNLYLVFERPLASAGAPKNIIQISKLSGFPEIFLQ